MFWFFVLIGIICLDFGLEWILNKKGVLKKSTKFSKILGLVFRYRVLSILAFVFFTTFKAIDCGNDTSWYFKYYSKLKIGECKPFVNQFFNPLEVGFTGLISLIAILKLPFQVLPFIVSGFVSISLVLMINKLSSNKFMSMVLFVALGTFAQMMTAYRQIIAVAFVMLAVARLVDKKWISSTILIVIATTFHVSAIVCLALIPLRFVKPNIWVVLGSFVFVIGVSFAFPYLLKFLEQYTPIDYYTKYYVRLTEFIVPSNLLNTLYSLALIALFIVLFTFRCKLLKLEEKDKKIYDFFLWIFMFVPLFRVAGFITNMPQLLNRFNMYFFCSLLVLIPLFIKGLKYNKKFHIVLNVAVYVVATTYMIYLYAIENTCAVCPFWFGF